MVVTEATMAKMPLHVIGISAVFFALFSSGCTVYTTREPMYVERVVVRHHHHVPHPAPVRVVHHHHHDVVIVQASPRPREYVPAKPYPRKRKPHR
jgi:hypothetical protein